MQRSSYLHAYPTYLPIYGYGRMDRKGKCILRDFFYPHSQARKPTTRVEGGGAHRRIGGGDVCSTGFFWGGGGFLHTLARGLTMGRRFRDSEESGRELWE